MKKIKKKSINPFVKCVELVVSTMKTPEEFLLFLTKALSSCNSFPNPNNNPQEYLIAFIERIVYPWVLPGENQEAEMRFGFNHLHQLNGAGEYQDHIAELVVSFGKQLNDAPMPATDADKYITGLGMMIKIGHILADYEKQNDL